MKTHDEVEAAGTFANAKPTAGTVSSSEGASSVDLLALLADAASLDSKGIHPGTNNEGNNQLFPDSNLQSDIVQNPICSSPSHRNASLDQTPVSNKEPQGTSPIAYQIGATTNCCGKTIPLPNRTIREESRQVVGMQVNVELDKNVPCANSETPHNQDLTLCTSCARQVVAPVRSIGSDMYQSCPNLAAGTVPSLEGMSISDLLALADAVSLRIKGIQLASPGVYLNQTQTSKQRRKKHRPMVMTKGIAKRNRKQDILKPVQSKGKPTIKYVRKSCVKSLNLELSEQTANRNAVQGDVHLGTGIDAMKKTQQTKVFTEGIANKTIKPIIPNPVQSKGKPTGKRKYFSKSCGRSLNLELSEQPGDGNVIQVGDETGHLGIGIDVLEKTHVAPGTYLSNTNSHGRKINAKSTKNRKRKGLVTSLVTTTQGGHEKYETQSSQNNSNSSKIGNLITGRHMGGNNRKHSTATDHADISHMNVNGVHYNPLHAYRGCGVQFPAVQKKRRSEKVSTSNHTSRTSLSSKKDLQFPTYPKDICASSSKCLISCGYNAVKNPVTLEGTGRATHDQSQAFESLLSFSQTRPTKTRSKTPTKFRAYATQTSNRNCNILPNQFTRQPSNSYMQTLANGERPVTSIDTLVAENMHASFKKKRSTRGNRKKCSIPTKHHDFLLNRYPRSWTMSLGAANMQIIEALTEKFRRLDINDRASSS